MITFKLKNIGLIENSEISLNNLTIICGQNNTGKTYITYSIYGFLSMWKDIIDFKISNSYMTELDDNGFCSIELKDFNETIPTILDNLSKTYASMLGNVFSVDDDWFEKSEFKVLIDNFTLNLGMGFKTTMTSSKKDVLQMRKAEESSILEVSVLNTNSKRQLPHFILEQAINKALGEIYFGEYFKKPFIITSERTGISLFYKDLDISKNIIVEHLTKNKSKDINPFEMFEEAISRYAMPVKHNIDYTRELADGVSKKKSFLHGDREITKYFADILQGSYKVVNKEVYFITKKNKKQIPMYFSSSATKSLIELYFYIKHSAVKGDLLIIDEPELNLHPDNHRKITRLLAHLSNKGIDIFITTHSDYMIKEFNNLIRLKHEISDKDKIMKKYGYKEYDILDYKKITSYINNSGKLLIAPIDNMGMEVETFDKVLNELSSSMDDILFNIVHSKAHLNNFHISRHNNKNCLSIKENDSSAKCKYVDLVGFESSSTTFAFELDAKAVKCGRNTKLSPYFKDKKGLDKGNDGIIFTTINEKRYVFICELKDSSKGHIAQFKSTSCFIDYLKSILKRFHNINTDDLTFKYIVFSKYGTTTKNTKGNYLSKNQEGFEVFNMKCCDKVEYYIESFI